MANAKDAVILAGSPAAVSGFVPFHNAGDTDVTIDEVVIRDPDTGEATLGVEPVTVAPGRTARISVRLSFQPQTAPGAYPLEITINDVTSPVAAYVEATRDVALSPDVLVVDNEAGSKPVHHLVVANQGNVPVYVADFGEVPLYLEDTALATLLALSRPTPGVTPTTIDPLPEPVATLAVSTGGGRATVPPGRTQAVGLTVTVPPGLSQSARYLGALPVALRSVLVAVVPAGDETEQPS